MNVLFHPTDLREQYKGNRKEEKVSWENECHFFFRFNTEENISYWQISYTWDHWLVWQVVSLTTFQQQMFSCFSGVCFYEVQRYTIKSQLDMFNYDRGWNIQCSSLCLCYSVLFDLVSSHSFNFNFWKISIIYVFNSCFLPAVAVPIYFLLGVSY